MNARVSPCSDGCLSLAGMVGWVLIMVLGSSFVRPAFALQVQDETKIALSGFSLSEAFNVEDDRELSIDETNLMKLVYRLWQTSLGNLEKYSQYTNQVGWDTLLADPPGFRMQVFRTQGRALSVTRIGLPETDEEPRFVYRIRCVTADGQPFDVLSLAVPQVWLNASSLDQPMSALGFFFCMIRPDRQSLDASDQVKSIQRGPQNSIPLFLVKQVSWQPSQPNPGLGIEPDHVLLAQHGVDIAGLETVRREDRKRLTSADARPFYEFLKAVAEIGQPQGLKPLDHMQLLRNPTQSFGRYVQFRARVKKCSVVRPPADISQPSQSIDQYYQLIVFPDLRDSRDEPTVVEIGRGEDTLAYRRFPFTVCCRHLPEGMTPASIENQQIWIDGFYFRFWLYDAERTTSAGLAGQISPIIIGNRPEMVASSLGTLSRFFNSLLLIFVGVLAIVGFTIFRIVRRTRRSRSALPEKLDVDGLAEM